MTEKEKEAEEAKKVAEAKKAEEEKEEFAKDGEKVDANKHNQALRKARELEAEKRELEDEAEKLKGIIKSDPKPVKKVEVEGTEEGDDDDDDDDFWDDDKKKKTPKVAPDNTDQIKSIINEQIRPFVEAETTRKKVEKKQARQEFYDNHPEYLSDADKWADLLDELNSSIIPSGDYYQDLEKAHRITGGEDFNQVQIEKKKKEIATNTSGGGANTQKTKEGGDYKMTEMDNKIMESTGVEADTIKEMRELQAKGLISLEF